MATETLDLQSDPPPDYGSADTSKILESEETADSEENRKVNRKKLVQGMLLSVLYAVALAFSVPCLQLLGSVSMGSMELLLLAYSAHVLCSVPVWLICSGRLCTLVSEEGLWLLVAASANGTATAFFYLSAEVLPSGVIGAVEEGTFLLFSILVTWYLNKHMGKLLLVAAAICLLGLILFAISSLVMDPLRHQNRNLLRSLVMPTKDMDISKAVLYNFHPSMAYLLLVLSAVLLAIANLIINRKFHETPFVKLLLFFPVVGLVTSLMITYSFTSPVWDFALIFPDEYLPFMGFILLFIISATSLYAAWMLTPAPIFGLISSGGIVLYLVLHYTIPVPGIHPGTPDALEYVGAFLIILANIIGPLSELGLCPPDRLEKKKEET